VIRVFAGHDPREAIGFHVFLSSLMRKTATPFALAPVTGARRDGTNDFAYARFCVPSLCGFEGWAIFVDGSDMLMRADIAELWALRDESKAVQVVQHSYKTRHLRKYVGTALDAWNEDYPRKNWSSVVLWNCGHHKNRILTPDTVEKAPGSYLHRFEWLDSEDIGSLPPEWNLLVGEQEGEAKIAHFTVGIPAFPQYADCAYADEWRRELQNVSQSGVM
jgi:hypothetical protein